MRHAVGYHVNILLFFHLHSGSLPGLGLARRPEADLDGVGICEVAAVVLHPVFPSTGPPDHSRKLPGFAKLVHTTSTWLYKPNYTTVDPKQFMFSKSGDKGLQGRGGRSSPELGDKCKGLQGRDGHSSTERADTS